MLVAEGEEELAGFIAAIGNNLKRTQHRAYIVIGLLEEFRGKGIGKSLFEQLFIWAKQNGITRLELTVIKENDRAF